MQQMKLRCTEAKSRVRRKKPQWDPLGGRGLREARGIFEMIDTKIQVLMKNLNQNGIISQKGIKLVYFLVGLKRYKKIHFRC